jgi:hypothetical protein
MNRHRLYGTDRIATTPQMPLQGVVVVLTGLRKN